MLRKQKRTSYLPARQPPAAIIAVATMNTQPIGSPNTTTERKAPMKGDKA